MTAPHSADQPLDDLDQVILDQLAAVLTRLDPPPPDLDDRVRLVLALDDIDSDVARLREEQLVGAVRGTERTRTLTFDAESRTVMITIVERPDGLVRIDGWLAPGAAVRVELRHPAPDRPRLWSPTRPAGSCWTACRTAWRRWWCTRRGGSTHRRWSRRPSRCDVDPAALARRASRWHAAGLASSDAGQPGRAARELRAGLRLAKRHPALQDIHARLLISLAWAESERGRVELGFRLLDEAEALVAPPQRPILLGQRALLLKRSGRNAEALRQYDESIGLLSNLAHPPDLVKALNNRSLVHLEAGNVRLARADLRRCAEVAARHGLDLHVAMARTNLGCLDVIAGDLPAALRAFARSDADYRVLAPGRLANLAVERARALVAAGLYREAERQLASAVERATQQQLRHDVRGCSPGRAEAALLDRRAGRV
ncbi:tetratricopeptide repeat protein, partial [Micromonospora tarensis]|nr:hypothetical protein [Micromonospora tarensis]